MFVTCFIIVCVGFDLGNAAEPVFGCRYRSNHLRLDGGLCFEIQPWQHLPVDLEDHLITMRSRWGKNNTNIRRHISSLPIENSVLTLYMDTVLGPFLETYHRNIQNSYQQLTSKILTKTKDEINSAVQKKIQVFSELTQLADGLNLPKMCDEERRETRTTANKHVAQIYSCAEDARDSIAKMSKYAEEMIGITKNHMQETLLDVTKKLNNQAERSNVKPMPDVSPYLKELSLTTVLLGYELDLSLTNARRHNEQSCEKLTSCIAKTKRHTEDSVSALRDHLYQCVYA